MKISLVRGTILGAALFALTATGAHAQYGAYGQYGSSTPSNSIQIEKFVTRADNGVFVENLSPSDTRFGPNSLITFRLRVRNSSGVELRDVVIRDFLPEFVTVKESAGSVNSDTLTINVGTLASGEEKTYDIKVQLTSQDHMPADRGVFCLVNKVEVRSSGPSDEDSSQFCVEKNAPAVSQVPSAGPEAGIGLMGLYSAALASGLYLRKRAK